MNTLPKWMIANPFPAIHDFESLTVLDQTARIYGAMNQMIGEWNQMIEKLSEFENSETDSREEFEMNITKVIREFVCSWDQKVEDLELLAEKTINDAIEAGKIAVKEEYDSETESLRIYVGGRV